jgi:hypothetical protein
MTKPCYIVWTKVEDEDGHEGAVWDEDRECTVITLLVAVCDDKVLAESIAESVKALEVWITERPMNTLIGRVV